MMIDAWKAADKHFPLITGSEGKTFRLSQACEDVKGLCQLTDEWVNQVIRNSTDPFLETARKILRRIDDRDLYKSVTQIENGAFEKKEADYEKSIRTFSASRKESEADVDVDHKLKLNPEDLVIVKKS